MDNNSIYNTVTNLPLHHLGYCCKNISNALDYIKKNDPELPTEKISYDNTENITHCKITLTDNAIITLSTDNIIPYNCERILELAYVAYETVDIYKMASILKNFGALEIIPTAPDKLFNSQLTTTLKTDIGLIKLINTSNTESLKSKTAYSPLSSDNQTIQATPNQQWLWLIDNLATTSWYYNMPLALKIKGSFNIWAFREAFSAIVKRHASLRTVFRNIHGTVHQLVLKTYELPVFIEDAEVYTDHKIKTIVESEFTFHFKLNENHLLFRARILRLNQENHLLILNMHHSIFDGWSFDILFRELAILYEHYCYQTPEKLKPLKLNYPDFTLQQNQRLSESSINQKLKFWKKHLTNTPNLAFPLDYPRPKTQNFYGKYLPFEFDVSIVNRLQILARDKQTSVFTLALSAFYVLLSKYANQEDLAFGIPVAGRTIPNTQDIIGYFTNILAIRFQHEKHISFDELLEKTKTLLDEAYKNQDIPFGKVIEQLSIKRDLSHNPLFQILFAYQNIGLSKLQLPHLEITPYRNGYDAARLDFTFEIEEHNNCIRGGVYYDIAILEERTIQNLVESYKEILKQITDNSSIIISDISLLSTSNNITNPFEHDTPYRPITKTLLIDRFNQQASRNPENIAVQYNNDFVTYNDLNNKATALAAYLQSKGLTKGNRVAVKTGKNINLIISILACFKAGFIYLPLDPSYPENRLLTITNDANVSIVLSNNDGNEIFENEGIRAINLEDEWPIIMANKNSFITINISSEDTAYIFYTSGTTGKPKGAKISHYNIANLFLSTETLFQFSCNDNILLFHSYTFDVSLWEIFSALCYGGKLVIASRENILNIEQLHKMLTKEKITVLNETPSAFNQLLIYEKTQTQKQLNHLRYVILAGEALKAQHIKIWHERYTNSKCHIINMYGITETTVYSSYKKITETIHSDKKSMIGKGIPGVQLYILDKNQHLLPPNVSGEIYIAGHGVGDGYVNLPELTKEKFLKNNLSKLGKYLYKTGDLGKQHYNGEIEYLGRIDDQVKLRGYRIEPKEIESILLEDPRINDTIVLLQEDEKNENLQRLIAYIIPITAFKDETLELETDLHALLKSKLPDYMIPEISFLEKFPLTINGKIDKQSLPKKSYMNKITPVGKKPNSAFEIAISDLWREMLNLEIDDTEVNFFDVGGNSLFAMQLYSRLVEKFHCDIKMSDIFTFSTIKKLAAFIEEKANLEVNISNNSKTSVEDKLPTASENAIAIIGMAGRFPDADNIEAFWENIKAGKESISRLTKKQLHEKGVPQHILEQENFVCASGLIDNIDQFDADFFGYSPKEATLTSPQHRCLLEIAHQALEKSGYAASKFKGKIATYVAMSDCDYLHSLIASMKDQGLQSSAMQLKIANEKDYLATKIAYSLGLTGAAININTACSSSLVAIVKACQSLAFGESDMVLAGGISIVLPHKIGYLYEAGSIFAKDGFCRTFDDNASGTVPSSAAGIVVLKRLSDAINDGDTIHGVLSGYAVNNDGNNKVSFTAPSTQGQAECIRTALSMAKINPKKLSYVEAHGTGTKIGDPIELQALHDVFKEKTDKESFCILGSAKNNIGHTQSASGVVALIKTICILKEKIAPPHINYETPNKLIDMDESPFIINKKLKPLKKEKLYAGVSSFGIGGTNAHVIVENHEVENTQNNTIPFKLIVLSAKSPEALSLYRIALKSFLQNKYNANITSETDLDDIAYTLQVGREELPYRQAWIVSTPDELIKQLDVHDQAIVCDQDLQNPYFRQLFSAAKKWIEGNKVNWEGLHNIKRGRTPLPTYPFIRQKYWHESLMTNNTREHSVIPTKMNHQDLNHHDKAAKLLDIFANSLGYDNISPLDNFINLGGDSLIAINITSKIEKEFGHTLDFDGFSEKQNIQQIIDNVLNNNEHANSISLLKKLKIGNNQHPPIFLIHPGNGSLFYYENLISKINFPGEIWGIENPILEESYTPLNSIEEMASHYISLIKEKQKTGPYYLSGWSLGASVAFEMARQLENNNEVVAKLIFIDAWYKYNLALHTQNFFYETNKNEFAGIEKSKRVLLVNLLRTRYQTFMNYHPKPVKAHISLIKAELLTEEFNVADDYNNWKPFALTGIDVTTVPGDHLSIFDKKNINYLANAYQAILDTINE